MPDFDRTGPTGKGACAGKKLGECFFPNDMNHLGRRLKKYNRGCGNMSSGSVETLSLKDTEIVGVKRCKKKLH